MSWWRNKAKDQRHGEVQVLIQLVRDEQRLNGTLVMVVQEQTRVIRQLLDEKARRYPATTGIQVTQQ